MAEGKYRVHLWAPPSHRELSDRQLVVRTRGGDCVAYDALVVKYWVKLCWRIGERLARGGPGLQAHVEDVAQDAFTDAWINMTGGHGSFRLALFKTFEGYLNRIALRGAARILRRSFRERRFLRKLNLQCTDRPSEHAPEESAFGKRERALSWQRYYEVLVVSTGLDERERQLKRFWRKVFRLWLRGLRQKEIAAETHAHRSRVWRALRAAQELMASELD